MMGIEVPGTCWAYYKCNKPFSGILLVFLLFAYATMRRQTHIKFYGRLIQLGYLFGANESSLFLCFFLFSFNSSMFFLFCCPLKLSFPHISTSYLSCFTPFPVHFFLLFFLPHFLHSTFLSIIFFSFPSLSFQHICCEHHDTPYTADMLCTSRHSI